MRFDFLILILLNLKTLRKAVFGRLPLEFNKNAFEGPVTYTYKEDSIPLKLDIYYPTKSENYILQSSLHMEEVGLVEVENFQVLLHGQNFWQAEGFLL